jgi:hypothetical protein
MGRRKRDLFLDLLAGIRAMHDHAEAKVKLRTTRVNPSRTGLRDADSRRASSQHRRRRHR